MLKPYYQDEAVTIYHGDAREIMPLCGAQAMITDPVWPNCPPGLLVGSEDPLGLFKGMMNAIPKGLLRIVVILRHDSDPRFLAPVPMPYFRAAILPYVMPGYIGRKLGGDELAYCFGEPVAFQPGRQVIPGRAPMVQPGGRHANGHPCSRALIHMRWLVNWWSEPGETVIDPYGGSGQTARACKDLGRKAIIIEIEERFCEIAAKNQAQEVLAL